MRAIAPRLAGRRVGYCGRGGRACRAQFQRKDFEIVQQDQVRDPSPTNRAVSIRCRMFSVMSELGSKSEVGSLERHVRSTLNSRRRRTAPACPVRADFVAKVPKCLATNFPLEDETSDDR